MKKKSLKQEEGRLGEKAKPGFLLLLIFLFSAAQAAPHFTYTSTLIVAQDLMIRLRLDEARSILQNEQTRDGENLLSYFLDRKSRALELFITENPEVRNDVLQEIDQCITRLKTLPETEPYRNYAIGDLLFYSACIKGKSEEFYSAALDLKSAYNYIKDNQDVFPDFEPNNKVLGLVQSFLSTVPDQYSWTISLLGLKADLESGLTLLRDFAYSTSQEPELQAQKKETGYFYAYTLYHIAKRRMLSWKVMQDFTSDYQSNLLSVFFRSTLAENLRKNEEVIRVLEERPQDNHYLQFYYLDYLLGEAKLNRLDEDAHIPLLRFYENYGGYNYIKTCLQKLSWHYLIQGNEAQYHFYKNLIKLKGKAINEDDKLAELYTNKPMPHVDLLKTRMLYDGGYIEKAYAIIKPLRSKDFGNSFQKAEYAYRKARIHEAMNQIDLAIKFYEFASIYGEDSPEYYASYACLYLGDHSLKQGDSITAREWYKQALSYEKNLEYKSSIEQWAKRGLKQCDS